jgi:hypothetical protein
MALQHPDKQQDEDKKDDAALQTPPSQARDAEKEGTPAEKLLDSIIRRYGADPIGIARGVFELSPRDRDDVMHLVQKRFGNGFVCEVELEIGKLNQIAAAPSSLPLEEQQKEPEHTAAETETPAA